MLSRWALATGLMLLGVLVTFAIGTTASQGSALAPEYDELVWAAGLPALYRLAATLAAQERAPRAVSRKTAFSPSRLCIVSGIQVPSCCPELLKATARSSRSSSSVR